MKILGIIPLVSAVPPTPQSPPLSKAIHPMISSFTLPTCLSMSTEHQTSPGYQSLIGRISEAYRDGRFRAQNAVNTQLLATYWQIGHDIVEFEQGGQVRADYGSALFQHLSHDLTRLHEKGFIHSNLIRVRQFYLAYPKGATPSHFLTWPHLVELLKIEDNNYLARIFCAWIRETPSGF